MITTRVVMALLVIVCAAGVALGQTMWEHHPDNPVIRPGPAGSWDEGGHWSRSVIFDGSTYHLWFIGADEGSDPHDIGHATSPDGVTWTMDPANPVLTRGATGEWDDGALTGAAVIHDGTQFRMWYAGRNRDWSWAAGYATSPDGAVWTKYSGNPVMVSGPPGTWEDNEVRPTTVIVEDGTYRMWYSGRSRGGSSQGWLYRVGYAESSDGIEWTKYPEPVLEPSDDPGAWDAPSVMNPYVVVDGSIYHMWYAGGIEDYPNVRISIGYAFSSDGIEWTRYVDNPVVESSDAVAYSSSVLFDGTTWRMWYSHWDGYIDWVSYATSTCCDVAPSPSFMRVIPAAAFAFGAQGSFFLTDVDVNNADDITAAYQFIWLPRGDDNSDPMTSVSFTLEAGMSVRYENVVGEVFGLEPESLGALAITADSPDLLLMSRTYNIPTAKIAGTFGQALPGISLDEMQITGETRRIIFLSQNADVRANVGCVNGTDQPVTIDIDLYDAAGTMLETRTMDLGPWSNDQINRIFRHHAPVDGYVDVSSDTADAAVYCYGSVLDNETSDPTTILPQ